MIKVMEELSDAHLLTNGRACLRSLDPKPDIVVSNLTNWDLSIPLAQGWVVPLVVAPFVPPTYRNPDFCPFLLCGRLLPLHCLNVLAADIIYFLISSLSHTTNLSALQQEAHAEKFPAPRLLDQFFCCPYLAAYSSALSPCPAPWLGEDLQFYECGPFMEAELSTYTTVRYREGSHC